MQSLFLPRPLYDKDMNTIRDDLVMIDVCVYMLITLHSLNHVCCYFAGPLKSPYSKIIISHDCFTLELINSNKAG